jgi:hypothetical protein
VSGVQGCVLGCGGCASMGLTLKAKREKKFKKKEEKEIRRKKTEKEEKKNYIKKKNICIYINIPINIHTNTQILFSHTQRHTNKLTHTN